MLDFKLQKGDLDIFLYCKRTTMNWLLSSDHGVSTVGVCNRFRTKIKPSLT